MKYIMIAMLCWFSTAYADQIYMDGVSYRATIQTISADEPLWVAASNDVTKGALLGTTAIQPISTNSLTISNLTINGTIVLGTNVAISTWPATAPSVTPMQSVTSTATVVSDVNLGTSWKILVTNDMTLSIPTNGVEGTKVVWRMTAEDLNRWVTLGTGFRIPDSSSLSNSFMVASNTMTLLMSERFGTNWLIQSYVTGY